MSSVLLADVAAFGPIDLAGGVCVLAGIAATVGVALGGLWFARRGRRPTPPRE